MSKKQTEQVQSEKPKMFSGRNYLESKLGKSSPWLTAITVLGVVYGDIGTSPLYALQKGFSGEESVPAVPENILGLLSLIFWALMLIISVKYILYVMRASNENEGGILALMALIEPAHPKDRSRRMWLILIGVFGAALLYGDGMITPAISVMSAVEGLKIAEPQMEHFIVPITIAILVVLFLFQKQGTSRVGWVFGPVMGIWFMVLLLTGLSAVFGNPSVLKAVNPVYAIDFIPSVGFKGFLLLGAVFLVVTGGEALYADIGHFGKKPIRIAWFILVLPALVINYFGQGAILLSDPAMAGEQIFYHMAPDWALYPMVIMATIATIIASQAIISASFSLTRQAVLLGFLPRLKIVQTSSSQPGQIYISGVNWVLMVATIGLVIGFQKSVNLAGAYGVAVSTTMVITTILMFIVAKEKWKWPLWLTVTISVFFMVLDLLFLGANYFKITHGGWFPLLIAGMVFMIIFVWRTGQKRMAPVEGKRKTSLKSFMLDLKKKSPERIPGTAVYLTKEIKNVSLLLLRQLDFMKVLNERVVLLTAEIMDEPKIEKDKRLSVKDLGKGIQQVIVHYGFMENPNVPNVLKDEKVLGEDANLQNIIYYIEYPRIVFGGRWGWKKFIAKIFSFMARNAANPIEFFKIPFDQVFEVGVRVHLR
ncbi:MAG: KUP/HAK/KT family potassium transporter [Bacteroidales bacterium]|nr:KUP/HAK/KT family potassium transporter [Bacteroidales bacterium]